MLMRLVLLGLFFAAVLRFFGRLFAFFLRQGPTVKTTTPKKKRTDLDDSQIQDADFKDL